jgi:starch synthase (maltosyl-transferring)
MDVVHVQEGEITLPPQWASSLGTDEFLVRDCLSGERYLWRSGQNYIRLDPGRAPGHIIEIDGSIV